MKVVRTLGYVVLFTVAVLSTSVALDHFWPNRGATLPAWMQAVGSVFGLAVIFIMSHVQFANDKNVETFRRNADDRRRLLALKAVNKQLIDLVGRIQTHRAGRTMSLTPEVEIEKLRSLSRLLSQLPIFDIPADDAIILHHEIQALIPDALHFYTQEYQELAEGRFRYAIDLMESADKTTADLGALTQKQIDLCNSRISKLTEHCGS